jgi:hypothetical protein
MTEIIAAPDLAHVKIKIEQDTDASSPRLEFDNAAVFVCFHRRYKLGDKHDYKDPSEFKSWLKENSGDIAIRVPLFMYDHSGLTVSTRPFSCPWDSGQIGEIYMTKETVEKEFGGDIEKAKSCIEAEVSAYDQYLQGDVYGYVIEDENGTQVDSLWGLYGRDYAIEAAKSAAKTANDTIHAKKSTDEAAAMMTARPDMY